MSESLPEAALPVEPEVPSVEDAAPGDGQEVVEESARGVDTVPAARFNGLMGKFNQTQAALQKAQETIRELEGRTQESQPMTDVSNLEQQVAALQSMLMEERLESAKAKAIQEFPGAAAFADLIIADSPEQVRNMAQVLHERVSQKNGEKAPEPPAADGQDGAPEVEQPPAVEPPPAAPVVAGGTSLDNTPPDNAEKIAEAIKNRDFASFLRAKSEQLASTQGELVL